MNLFVTMQSSLTNPSFPHLANCLKAVLTKRHLALNAPNLSHNTADEGDRLGGGRQGAWPIVYHRLRLLAIFSSFQSDLSEILRSACYFCRLGKVTGGYRPPLYNYVQMSSSQVE